jgi:hypothetical protein
MNSNAIAVLVLMLARLAAVKKTKFCERLRYTTTNVAFHSRSNQDESGPVDNTTDLIETVQKGALPNCLENISTTASTGREIIK